MMFVRISLSFIFSQKNREMPYLCHDLFSIYSYLYRLVLNCDGSAKGLPWVGDSHAMTL